MDAAYEPCRDDQSRPVPGGQPASLKRPHIKRLIDIAFAGVALAVLGLCLPAIVLLNAVSNRGPLFYRQTRMGFLGQPFTILKLRTMRAGRVRDPDAPVERDRITPFGAVLRATHLDELPQALNILAGEMSLVGPRPDVWAHAVRFSRHVPGYGLRHAVRPGLTGLAQVREGYGEGFEGAARKTAADLDYIAGHSLALDVVILLRTALVLGGRLIGWRGKRPPSPQLQPQS